MKQLKVYYEKHGGHYHCRLFIGEHNQTFAKVGELTFDENDWKQLPNIFTHATLFINETTKENKS